MLLYRYCFIFFVFEGNFRVQAPGGLYSWFEKVVWKNVDATIPKGNMRYDQHTVPDIVAVEPSFVSFF